MAEKATDFRRRDDVVYQLYVSVNIRDACHGEFGAVI